MRLHSTTDRYAATVDRAHQLRREAVDAAWSRIGRALSRWVAGPPRLPRLRAL
jgi:hypothetical protein